MKPAHQDIRRLKAIAARAADLESAIKSLSEPSKQYLTRMFEGGTLIHIINFQRNIRDALLEFENPETELNQ